jgi:23S rRNA pseudouridine1911/1915/1917 synthase
MAYIGHPLLGDEMYGGPSLMFRPALHSARLQLRQPVSKNELIFTAQLPDDMNALIGAKIDL